LNQESRKKNVIIHLQERVQVELKAGQPSQPLPSPFNLIAEQGVTIEPSSRAGIACGDRLWL
jgi:hypothetical protein